MLLVAEVFPIKLPMDAIFPTPSAAAAGRSALPRRPWRIQANPGAVCRILLTIHLVLSKMTLKTGIYSLTMYIVQKRQKIRGWFLFFCRCPGVLRNLEGDVRGMSTTSVITVTNQKGGVGKTTTAAALLAALHKRGARVLGVDLDPQGSLGFSLGLDIEHCVTVYDVFRGAAEPQDAVSRTESGDLLPSNILLSAAELEFNKPGREFLLKNALSRLTEPYDFIIVDTPPALNILTVNAYVATDSLIIPMAPEVLSLLGVAQIKETIESVRSYYNSRLKVLGILLNRFNARLNLNREVSDLAGQIAAQLDTRVFQTRIRSSVSVAEAPAHGISVVDYAPASKPALDFEALCDEIAGAAFPRPAEPGTREAR